MEIRTDWTCYIVFLDDGRVVWVEKETGNVLDIWAKKSCDRELSDKEHKDIMSRIVLAEL